MTDNIIRDVVTLANSQWLNILNSLCGEIHYKKARPCPACGGNDRFTFDDLEGRGTYVCRGCGSGDALSLVAKVHSVNARQAALMVAPYVGLSVGQSIDSAAIERSRHKVEASRLKATKDRALKHERAAKRAKEILLSCKPALASNAYLAGKGLKPFDTYELINDTHLYGDYIMGKGSLVVPIFNFKLSGLQFVQPSGDKHILAGTKVKGSFYPLSANDSPQIYIGEGFATCGAVADCLVNTLVVCAFNAGNLVDVALGIHASRPHADIIIIADNDESGAGEREAIKAALAVGGSYIMPPALEAA